MNKTRYTPSRKVGLHNFFPTDSRLLTIMLGLAVIQRQPTGCVWVQIFFPRERASEREIEREGERERERERGRKI